MTCIGRYDAVRATAGHDSGRLYLVIDLCGSRAAVSDGDLRRIARPKLKNLKHLELVAASALSADAQDVTDRQIRKLLAALSRATN